MPDSASKRISLDADLCRRLSRMADRQGRSLTNLGNLLLRRSLGMSATPPQGAQVRPPAERRKGRPAAKHATRNCKKRG